MKSSQYSFGNHCKGVGSGQQIRQRDNLHTALNGLVTIFGGGLFPNKEASRLKKIVGNLNISFFTLTT